jgi:glycosyltransferase involved in cell wall biosynthesis
MACALATATGIVANSAHTLATLSEFAAREGLPLPPATVAWPGTPALPAMPEPPAASKTPHFVVLGTIEGRKNHQLLLDIWPALARQNKPPPRLVMIGRRGWQADAVFAALDAGVEGVVEAGALDDTGIAAQLAGARALLFPSLAEGYGLPLVEALAAGVPVIASDLPVFREIGRAVPELLPPDNAEAWMAAITDYARPDSPRRAEQLQRLQGFRAPDWRDHFAAVDALLETLGS